MSSSEEKLATEKHDELIDEVDDEPVALADASASRGPSSDEVGASKKTIGLERWVQLGFVVAAILLVWLYDHLINAVWYVFADPDESLATTGAVLAGVVTAALLYRNPAANGLVQGVTEELSKVTWPTRKETSSSTIVVVVTSIVVAVVLFLFDSVWSAVTDLVYKV